MNSYIREGETALVWCCRYEAANRKIMDKLIEPAKTATEVSHVDQPAATIASAAKSWKPQPCGISREEMQAIIADMIG